MIKKKRRLFIQTSILLLLISAVGYTLYVNFTKEARGQLKVGDHAPDFVLRDMGRGSHRLSDYKGEGIFLNFLGAWCKPCEEEMPYMNNQYNQFKSQGVHVLAINVGESDILINRFITKHNLSFPILVDVNKDVQNVYGIDPLPTTMLINPEGTIVDNITGTMTEYDIKENMKRISPT